MHLLAKENIYCFPALTSFKFIKKVKCLFFNLKINSRLKNANSPPSKSSFKINEQAKDLGLTE
jgi:hypothetical protein